MRRILTAPPASGRPVAMKNGDTDSDALRLNDLAKQYGLECRRVGSTYQFDDFTAHGLKQALGFVEGYDRAARAKVGSRPNVYRLEVLALREILADDSTDFDESAHRDWLKRRLDEETRFVASIPAKLDTRRR
jgi:hypothetical protein